MLVLSIPFYSANAMAASVQINRNSGEQNIPRYLDAESDVWTVQATITGSGAETFNPSDVTLKIGNNEASFTSCSAGTLGIVCEYLSPLTDGIQEAEYAFQVIYRFLNNVGVPDSVSNGEVIRADGSAPSVIISQLQQNAEGKVEIDFTVKDKVRQNAPAVGIKTIEILDADSGNVLQTISIPETGKEQYNYRADGGFSGILQASLAGEGLKRIKVRAEDWLGHQSAAAVRTFRADFVAPVIKDNLNFTDLGRFIGEFVVSTDITIDVEEASTLEVKATSSLANIDQRDADCEEDLEQIGLWHCIWQEVEVNPLQDTITVVIAAKDEFGNTAERTLTKTFTKDTAAPVAEFFGTERMFDGKSYVRSGRQRLILKVSEQGAGITADGIRANVLALGGSNAVAPTECTSTDAGLECYWDTAATLTAGVARVGLSQFQDNVGNLGLSTEAELVVDNSGPKVEKVELYGGEKDYVQSNDPLKLRIKAIETSGMVILVNLNSVVMDAENKFPETHYTRNLVPTTGWQVFTEDSCEKTEGGYWDCEILTDPVRSGPENNVDIEVHVQDTAGNEAAEWPPEAKNAEIRSSRNSPATLKFDLLGLSTEENPDYWEAASGFPRPLPGLDFVDLDTTSLTYTRIPLQLKFKSDTAQAKILNIQVQECSPAVAEEGASAAAPPLARTLLYGSSFPDGNPSPVTSTLILEFSPFDGREIFDLGSLAVEGEFEKATATYICHFRIFSEVGSNALAVAELQEVQVDVPFGFSTLGAVDENLAGKVKELKETRFMKFSGVLEKINTVMQWLKWISDFLTVLSSVLTLYALASEGLLTAAENAERIVPPTPVTIGLGTALRGNCVVVGGAEEGVHKWITLIQVPASIFSCNPSVDKIGGGLPVGALGFYGKWQRTVLDFYNVASGRDILGVPANSLYENIYTASLGLCIPGILYNVQKAREIQCRRIVCYAKEVPSGIATMEGCDRLYDLQMCEYFWGPFLDLTPLGGLATIGKMVQSFFTSPLGMISLAEIAVCSAGCFMKPYPSGWRSACSFTKGINLVLSIVDTVMGAIDNRPSLTASPYCSQMDNIDLDEVVGQPTPRPVENTVTSAESPEASEARVEG